MDPRDLPDARLRVQARQRDRAAEILREAVADGRLDVEELHARLPGALNAFTREDLYRVLYDLVPEAELPKVVAEGAMSFGDAPGMSWENPLIIRSDWKGHETKTYWDLPPFLEIIGTGWGQVTLDCILARTITKAIDIVITGSPQVTIIVPEGWGVDVQQLNASGASAEINSSVPTRPTGDFPRLILRGSTTMPVKVREGGNWWDRRRVQKAKAEAERAQLTDGS